MSKINGKPPKTADEVMIMLEDTSSLLQFIKDLCTQPIPYQDEYHFTAEGYAGFYMALSIVQDNIEACHKAIQKL